MKVFEEKGRINFVDKNGVFVGFDNTQSCCEYFGTYLSKNEIDNVNLIKQEEISYNEIEEYIFDKEYCKQINGNCEDGGMAIFKITNENGDVIYLHLYNSHNGYYAHGFTFGDKDCEIINNYL